ncbi:Hypothetical protein POVR1_LOCUS173 [uncultured virus]|nr:Hypothetical protein POVR1_LOCUS173 [uncultured virus]
MWVVGMTQFHRQINRHEFESKALGKINFKSLSTYEQYAAQQSAMMSFIMILKTHVLGR